MMAKEIVLHFILTMIFRNLKNFLKENLLQSRKLECSCLWKLFHMQNRLFAAKLLLNYFGEVYEEENCGSCDNCLNPREKFEGKEYICLLLETILAVKQIFKTKHVINVIMGKSTGTIKSCKHNQLEIFR
jgi:ATP-dependent DNA helicase RecQ